jgi:hypothetical protein
LAIKNSVDLDNALEWIQAKRAGVDPERSAAKSRRGYVNFDSDHPHSLETVCLVAFG